jgi:hypothetical protein
MLRWHRKRLHQICLSVITGISLCAGLGFGLRGGEPTGTTDVGAARAADAALKIDDAPRETAQRVAKAATPYQGRVGDTPLDRLIAATREAPVAAAVQPVPTADVMDPEAQWAQETPADESLRAHMASAVLAELGLDAKSVLDVDCRTSLCRLDFVIPTAAPDPRSSDRTSTPDNPHPERDVTTLFYPLSELKNATDEVNYETEE